VRSLCPLMRLLLLAVVIVAMAATLIPQGEIMPAYASELDELQRELEQLQKQMEDLLRKLSSSQAQERQVLRDLNTIEAQIDRTMTQLNKLESDLSVLSRQITVAESELAAAEAELTKRQDYLSRRVRAIYEGGTVGYLEVLLGSTSFADFLGRFELLRQLIAKDNELFQDIKVERAAVAQRKADLEGKRNQALSLQAQTAARKASFEYQQGVKERYLAQLEKDQNLYRRSLDELEETSRQIEEEIRRLAPWGTRPKAGTLLWPLTSRRISSYFGMRFHPILRSYRQHTGIDLPAATGTRIYAAEWGIVRTAGTMGGYGLTVMVDHGGGIWTLYAHMSKINVKVGETVPRGHVIGLVGSTGLSTGPHLHFEVRDNGTPVDPLKWLPK